MTEMRQIRNQIYKKLIGLVVVLLGVTAMSFLFVNLSPVDPAEALAQRMFTRPTQEQVTEIRSNLGLDKPLGLQYINWVGNALRGDFGTSLISRKPVRESIGGALSATMGIVLLAMLFSVLFTVPASILSALRKNGAFDKSVHFLSIIGISLPNYWLGFMLLIVFAVAIPLFKVSDFGSIKGHILPALALSIPVTASGIRVFRSSLLSGYHCDFVTYARARGLPEGKIAAMVVKYSLPPMVTLFAQNFGFLLGGSATVEAVFSWPGIGSLLIEAIMGRDLPVINGCVLIIAVIFVLVNFAADIINLSINPLIGTAMESKYV